MGNPAGVKRDFDALEKRRFRALRLFKAGDLHLSEVARRLHVARQTVSRWMLQYQADGAIALKKAGRAGRLPELTPGQLHQGGCPDPRHPTPEAVGVRNRHLAKTARTGTAPAGAALSEINTPRPAATEAQGKAAPIANLLASKISPATS